MTYYDGTFIYDTQTDCNYKCLNKKSSSECCAPSKENPAYANSQWFESWRDKNQLSCAKVDSNFKNSSGTEEYVH